MTTLQEQLELMREKMRLMADNEQKLVRGLGEALNVADERLREQVRQFAMEHNQRRAVALDELRGLSARLGALPKGRYEAVRQSAMPFEPYAPPRQQYQQPAYQGQPFPPQPQFEPAPQRPEAHATPPLPETWGQAAPAGAPGSGDWRRAASRIEEEINLYQNSVKARAR